MEINKPNLKSFRAEFQDTVRALEQKYNVKILLGNISYSDNEFHGKLTVSKPVDPAKKLEEAEKDFRMYAQLLDIPADSFGKIIKWDGKNLKIVGLNLNARKSPVILEDILTGKKYRGKAEQIKYFLYLDNKVKAGV